jgi:hypothetical protein
MTRHQPPRSMMWLALAVALVIAILMFASGCAGPRKTMTFQGETIGGSTTGLLVELDMTFAPDVDHPKFPIEWSTPSPFIHFESVPVGGVHSYSLKVFPIEPGQVVKCWITVDTLIYDSHEATFPAPAVCGGPPV